MSFGASPDVVDPDGHGGWTSGADQSLLFQTMSDATTHVGLHTGPDAFGFFSTAADAFAWTSRMAEQSLQPDFDPNLVVLFDKQAQGTVAQAQLSSGEALAVSINASPAEAIQAGLSSPFGFADFLSGDAAVRAARPVAVAETADGHNDQTAIVRLRQDGAGQSVAHLLSGRRSQRHDQRPASGRCRLPGGGAVPGLSDDLGRHVDQRAGLRRLRADGAAAT